MHIKQCFKRSHAYSRRFCLMAWNTSSIQSLACDPSGWLAWDPTTTTSTQLYCHRTRWPRPSHSMHSIGKPKPYIHAHTRSRDSHCLYYYYGNWTQAQQQQKKHCQRVVTASNYQSCISWDFPITLSLYAHYSVLWNFLQLILFRRRIAVVLAYSGDSTQTLIILILVGMTTTHGQLSQRTGIRDLQN